MFGRRKERIIKGKLRAKEADITRLLNEINQLEIDLKLQKKEMEKIKWENASLIKKLSNNECLLVAAKNKIIAMEKKQAEQDEDKERDNI